MQTNLLKLMEETEVPARSPNDIAGQIQAMMDFTQRGRKAPSTINTKHILFIVSGAFGGLEKIIHKRLREATIGFAAKERPPETPEEVLGHGADAGLHRVRLRAGVHRAAAGARGLPFAEGGRPVPDSEELRGQHHPAIRAGLRGLRHRGALLGRRACGGLPSGRREEQTGARGLMTVCERVFRDIKFELPSTKVKRFVVTRELVDDPAAELQKILADPKREERIVARQLVDEFARRFRENHGMTHPLHGRRGGPAGEGGAGEGAVACAICARRGSRISSSA